MEKNINCSFVSKCYNYKKMCDKCTLNSALNIGNYLEFEDKKSTVRFLEGMN